jgi:peptide chain release factor subunit 1
MTVASRRAPPVLRRANVERLVRFDGHGARVVSVYLDLDPERQVSRSYRIVLEDLAKAAREPLDKDARRDLEAEAAKVQEGLERGRPGARGLAVFSSSAAGLWVTYRLPAPVPDRLSFDIHPLVTPLLGLIEDLECYVVALVDKESARLLTVFEGKIESVGGVHRRRSRQARPGRTGPGPPAAPSRGPRGAARQTGRAAAVGAPPPAHVRPTQGPEEATAEVRERLPRELARRLVATVPAKMLATDAEILRITLEVEQRAERESEEGLATAVIDASRSNGPGACGMSATLETVWLRQVLSLVLADGLTATGRECRVDGRLYPDPPGPCPMCGAEKLPVGDIVDRASQLTLEQDGDVEIVHEGAAQRLRDACDSMGVVLRFRLHG